MDSQFIIYLPDVQLLIQAKSLFNRPYDKNAYELNLCFWQTVPAMDSLTASWPTIQQVMAHHIDNSTCR